MEKWYVIPQPWDDSGCIVMANSMDANVGKFICNTSEPMWHGEQTLEECQANARLIAAAPELLEACKAVMDMYDEESIFRHPRNCDAIQKLEHAIQKTERSE